MELKKVYVRTDLIVDADENGVIVKHVHVYKDILVESFKRRLLRRFDFWQTLFFLAITICCAFVYQHKILVFITGALTALYVYTLYNIISEEKNLYR